MKKVYFHLRLFSMHYIKYGTFIVRGSAFEEILFNKQ